MASIPGVLYLDKTFSRYKNKLLYVCRPYNNSIPIYHIPYVKKDSFLKNYRNKYILFKPDCVFNSLNIGIITMVIGDVSSLQSYYTYNMHCDNVLHSIKKFNSVFIKKLKDNQDTLTDIHKNYGIIDMTARSGIITIDPANCKDMDDAIGIRDSDDETIIDVYISNVSVILDILDLWDNVSERISTIYTPDKNINLLPGIMASQICSLRSNERKIVTCYSFVLDRSYNITDFYISCGCIIVSSNYSYDSKELLQDRAYHKIRGIAHTMSNVQLPEDIVEHYMVLTNSYSAKKLKLYKDGIFRVTEKKSNSRNNILHWESYIGRYTLFNENLKHTALDTECYTHITSPIRRLVDIINSALIQKYCSIYSYKGSMETFVKKWMGRIDHINSQTYMIRRMQSSWKLLELISKNKNITTYGLVVDYNNTGKLTRYTIFLRDLKFTIYFHSSDTYIEGTSYIFDISMYKEGETRKIRVSQNI